VANKILLCAWGGGVAVPWGNGSFFSCYFSGFNQFFILPNRETFINVGLEKFADWRTLDHRKGDFLYSREIYFEIQLQFHKFEIDMWSPDST
jgi:hypothetical protein